MNTIISHLTTAQQIITNSIRNNLLVASVEDQSSEAVSETNNTIISELDSLPLFDNGAGLDDIDQNSIGNCYFLASIGSIISQNPEFFENQIVDNGDGTFTATFYDENGDPVQITVETPDSFEIDGETRAGANDDSKETWLVMYEAAYAEWKGGIEEIEGGRAYNAMQELTGVPSIHQKPGDLSAEDFQEYFANNAAISLSSNDDGVNRFWFDDDHKDYYDGSVNLGNTGSDGGRLTPNHAYIVTDVQTYPNGEVMVTVQNPWDPDHVFEVSYDQIEDAFKRVDINPIVSN